MADNRQPLLSPRDEVLPPSQNQVHDHLESLPAPANPSFISSSTFNPDSDDIPPINGVRDFFREFNRESKKLWFLAGPAIFTSICQYSLGAVTQIFAGHVGTIDLAAVSVENSVIAGFSFGLLLGMGSALETLCGQAFGAGQLDMLGIYMQRSWVILFGTGVVLSFFYIFAQQILYGIGQTADISKAAGIFAIYMIPQLFAYAMNFPITKFLQSQSKIMVMAVIAVVVLIFHTVFSWLLMLKLGWGLVGAAVVLNVSWWIIVFAQLGYIVSGTCGRAWTGFSWKAFQNLWGFIKLSLASAVMLCLEVWYFMALILFAGYLKNAEVSVDGISICMNILGWTVMVSLGMNAAISVRVSNELGGGHPRTAKFSLVVAVITSFFRRGSPLPHPHHLPKTISRLVFKRFGSPGAGAGWQAVVAYVNIACYYIVGVPLGLLFGYYFDWGVEGIWSGMLIGTIIQTGVLFTMVYRTNWNKEASIAEDRIRKWGGESDNPQYKENKVATT
ncbi:hypothetical protein M0R45_000857 [Rubus argutus]|uniref:Protein DETOXIFICATION n=1 Tax=Rubus argutus TaxID=59490 RepID=A0AAW1VN80_RUBAR